MNERFKELALQAGAVFTDVHAVSLLDDEIEKFAESIVWECMLICEDVMKKDNSALGCWSEIKRKFRS
jgi:hypothetical protein